MSNYTDNADLQKYLFKFQSISATRGVYDLRSPNEMLMKVDLRPNWLMVKRFLYNLFINFYYF